MSVRIQLVLVSERGRNGMAFVVPKYDEKDHHKNLFNLQLVVQVNWAKAGPCAGLGWFCPAIKIGELQIQRPCNPRYNRGLVGPDWKKSSLRRGKRKRSRLNHFKETNEIH